MRACAHHQPPIFLFYRICTVSKYNFAIPYILCLFNLNGIILMNIPRFISIYLCICSRQDFACLCRWSYSRVYIINEFLTYTKLHSTNNFILIQIACVFGEVVFFFVKTYKTHSFDCACTVKKTPCTCSHEIAHTFCAALVQIHPRACSMQRQDALYLLAVRKIHFGH